MLVLYCLPRLVRLKDSTEARFEGGVKLYVYRGLVCLRSHPWCECALTFLPTLLHSSGLLFTVADHRARLSLHWEFPQLLSCARWRVHVSRHTVFPPYSLLRSEAVKLVSTVTYSYGVLWGSCGARRNMAFAAIQ